MTDRWLPVVGYGESECVWNPMRQAFRPRCAHVAFVGYAAQCQLEVGHEGDHRGGIGTADAWTHAADAPAWTESEVYPGGVFGFRVNPGALGLQADPAG